MYDAVFLQKLTGEVSTIDEVEMSDGDEDMADDISDSGGQDSSAGSLGAGSSRGGGGLDQGAAVAAAVVENVGFGSTGIAGLPQVTGGSAERVPGR